MAIVDTDTKSLIINQLTTDQLKELQEAGSVEDGQVYVTVDPLYHDLSNIDAMTADRALITDSNGKIDESATTSTELGYVHGVTSAIQTQLNAKASNDDLALKAPLASPALTGTPTAPTASSGTDTTQIATTAFVQTEISTKAPLASPALTGTPTAPTAEASTNNTQIATTAFVKTAVSNATPGVDNSTVETFDNSSAQGGSTHDLRVKDDGITINKMNSSAFTLKTSESKNSATIPSYAKVEEMVANATPVVDNSTISYNSSTELQAIGTINKNGGGTLYNWRGTLAEYEADVAAGTIQDNWICVITDDFNPGVTFSGEIVSVTKTFTTASNHVEFTEKCRSKDYLTVFQDRVFVYPSEYTLDNNFMGITFTSNIEQGSTVTVNYFKGVPSEKVDELIEAAKDVGIKKYESTSSYSTNELVVNVDNNDPQVYRSLADNNEAALTDTTKWSKDYLGCANSALSNSPYTTNRILEIPQNIKLELNNGTLTLKAGSKVYVPNGFESDGTTPKFDVITIESDIASTNTNNDTRMVCLNNSHTNFWRLTLNLCYSGNTAPTVSSYGMWYDTANNLLKYTQNGGSTWTSGGSLPLFIGTSSSTQWTSIDQVFNGFGYIGSTVFMLPDVKVQDVYGRNENCTYNSYIRKNNIVKILTRTSIALTNWMIVCSVFNGEMRDIYYIRNFKIVEKVPTSETDYTVLFNEGDGSYYYTNAGTTPVKIYYSVIPVVKNISCDANGKVTSFTPCDVNTVNTYSRSELSGLGMPSSKYEDWTLGATYATYIAPANGSFFVRKMSSALGQYLAVYYRDSANNPIGRNEWSSAANQTLTCMITVQKGTVVHIDYNAGGATNLFQFIYAEGEK